MVIEVDGEDAAALRQIWQVTDRIAAAVAQPREAAPGTSLSEDDQLTQLEGLASAVIWKSMSLCVEGLQAFAALWLGSEVLSRSTAFGFAHRPALIGACQAAWILGADDRDERLRRVHSVALTMTNDELDSKTDIASMQHIFQDDRRVRQSELDDLVRRRSALSRQLGGNPISLTRVFRELALALPAHRFFANDDAEQLGETLRAQWRTHSADCHGGGWQHRFSDPLSSNDDPNSLEVRREADVGMIIAKTMTAAMVGLTALEDWQEQAGFQVE